MYRYDSRAIQPGDTFIVLPKGEAYIEAAYRNGAISHVKMDRVELAAFADRHFGSPSQHLTVVGVTGTNGKTTVTHLVHQALEFAGVKSRLLGTLNATLTTPESWDVQSMMADHLANGGTHFVMEVSSHGIAQHRVDEIRFAVKLLTNITPDHLDFHQTFEAYRDTKLRFMDLGEGSRIFPGDFESLPAPRAPKFVGAFNQRNLRAAAAILSQLGIPADVQAAFFLQAAPPPGRFEPIVAGQSTLVIVDFAHTPDGLENVLKTARELAQERQGALWVVFGCGGDRDHTKRPVMGRIAAALADHVVITDDNPRSESPVKIAEMILEGIPRNADFRVIHDRREAISAVLARSQPSDVVLFAGKGHETYQIFYTWKLPYNERAEVRAAIERLMYARGY